MEEKRGSRNSHCYLEIAVIAKLIMVDGSNADWQLGLDLLIARAALDTELANHLTKDARLCCKENGIDLPDQIKLVVCSPDQEVVVKSLPLTQSATFTSIGPEKELVGSSTYNAGGQQQIQIQTQWKKLKLQPPRYKLQRPPQLKRLKLKRS